MNVHLFVYGTLQRGGKYHARFCGHAGAIEPATLYGRLYDLDVGYPALDLPPENVLARGTSDPLADAATQASAWYSVKNELVRPTGDWDVIHGELIVFADPAQTLPPIDRLEEFEPGRAENLFRRCLIPVQTHSGTRAAWVYIANSRLIASGRRIRSGRWP